MDHCRAELRAKLHQARKQVKRTVKNAKDIWLEKMCAKAEQKDAFQAWDAVKTIKQGFCGHYSKLRQSKLLKDDGTTTTSDFETSKVFCNYFTKVFNNIRPTDDSILDSITQHETSENLNAPVTLVYLVLLPVVYIIMIFCWVQASRQCSNLLLSSKFLLPLISLEWD